MSTHACRITVEILSYAKLVVDKGIHAFPKSISPKSKCNGWVELELSYYNVAGPHFNQNATETPSKVPFQVNSANNIYHQTKI